MQVLIRSALLLCFIKLNRLNEENGALFLPKAGRAIFNCCCFTMFFAY